MVISYLICEECGGTFPIPRKRHQLRKRGHVKHLWCYRCKKVTAHIEGNVTGTGGDVMIKQIF